MARSPTHHLMGQRSSCCKAPVTVSRADEGTCCFICSACEKSCNLDMSAEKNMVHSGWSVSTQEAVKKAKKSADDVQPPCEYCNGKGYNTRCYDEIGANDFGGEGYVKRGLIEKVPCRKCQPPAPAESAHEFMDDFSGCVKCAGFEEDPCEPPKKTVFKSAEVEKKKCVICSSWYFGEVCPYCENVGLAIQRDALQEETRILRASANYKMIAEQQKRIDALVEFAALIFTITDWSPEYPTDKQKVIETIMEMAHEVLYPSKPSDVQ